MHKFKRTKYYLVIILLFILFYFNKLFKDNFYNDDHFNQIPKLKDDEISIVINMKNLTKDMHIFFYEFMKKFKSKRIYYFIKTVGKPLNQKLNKIIRNSTVKIIQSNFPDTIFLPLVVSLYGKTISELVLFIEGEEVINNSGNNLL